MCHFSISVIAVRVGSKVTAVEQADRQSVCLLLSGTSDCVTPEIIQMFM